MWPESVSLNELRLPTQVIIERLLLTWMDESDEWQRRSKGV
jgi:hypothetical protein